VSSSAGMKYSVITFGCRVNQADSLGFEQELLGRGAVPSVPEDSDVVVVNTCSVTASADQAARQTIRKVARLNPDARIIVTGCYATRRPAEVAALPNVLQVVPNGSKGDLVRGIQLVPSPLGPGRVPEPHEMTTADRFGDGESSCGATIQPGVAGRTAFTLRVQTGCSEPCSYCIIPATRGTPLSLPLRDVLAQVDRVVGAGFREIVLTGVHLGSYGREADPPASLGGLLRALDGQWASKARGFDHPDVLFRLSSLEPMDCTAEIIDLVARSSVFAPYFHLPLQHASDRLLASMRRPYTSAYYADLVGRIRRQIPSASIGSDVIVGFPGETDADFDVLAAYLEQSPLTHLHVFPYSDRPGTAAAVLPEKVHGPVVRDRASRVRAISSRLWSRFRQSQIGTTHRALTLDDGTLVVTGNYLKLRIPPGHARNEWVSVQVGEGEQASVRDLA
jgi:threonylcarbamoyladenosine tRNA methylthiotransferase MtaB